MFNEKKIIQRYEKSNGKYIIGVSFKSFRDIFNKFDSIVSFNKRDLDPEFAQYLFECALELSKKDFIVRLDAKNEKKTSKKEKIVNESIDSYFEYEKYVSRKKIKGIMKKSFVHIFVSVLFLIISYICTKKISHESLFLTILLESIMIAAWVFMWPIFSDFLYEFKEENDKIKIYDKLINADIVFHYKK